MGRVAIATFADRCARARADCAAVARLEANARGQHHVKRAREPRGRARSVALAALGTPAAHFVPAAAGAVVAGCARSDRDGPRLDVHAREATGLAFVPVGAPPAAVTRWKHARRHRVSVGVPLAASGDAVVLVGRHLEARHGRRRPWGGCRLAGRTAARGEGKREDGVLHGFVSRQSRGGTRRAPCPFRLGQPATPAATR